MHELFAAEGDEGSLFPAKRREEEANFDITAMIDLVFMMNIYFMVTALVTAMAEINLAQAAHCTPADTEGAVVITVVADGGERGPQVFVGEGAKAPTAAADQEKEIQAAVEKMLAAGYDRVIIKAEQDVAHKDVAELMRFANDAGEIRLFLGVHETN
ncbi:MAG TPA: biopolymer transporter ExbD [Pirellulales bacterium]|nr:biopolymer transporter ExbD [Pirellulales bacterium]